MQKLIIILLVIFNSMYSDIYIDSVNSLSYPEIEANYYKLNESAFNLDSVFLFEQANQVEISSFDLVSGELQNLNMYFMIDVSSSMRRNSSTVDSILTHFINNMQDNDSVGIMSFNQNCYVNTFKTNDKSKLNISKSIINYYGSSNLNELFFNSPLSVENIYSDNEHYVLISNKQSPGDYQKIKDFFDDNNLKLSIIYLSSNKNEIYKNIQNSFFLNLDKFSGKLPLLYKYFENRVRNNDYYKIKWETNLCSDVVKGNILQSPIYNYDFEYNLEFENEIVSFEPEFFSINNYPVNEEIKFEIKLTTNFKDIDILSVISSNPDFTITNNVDFLPKGVEKKINISITPPVNRYYFTNIIVETECSSFIIPLELGEYDNSNSEVDLVVNNSINQQNEFYRGDKVDIGVLGLAPSDTINVEYKAKNEDKWNDVVQNYNGNGFNWVVPNLAPTTLDFRISFKSANFKKYDLKNIDLNNRAVNQLKNSYDNKYACFITQNNQLAKINLESNSVIGNVVSNLTNVNLYAWNFNNLNIVLIRNNDNTPLIFDVSAENPEVTLDPIPDKATAIEFNHLSNQVIVGSENGNLYIYNDLSKESSFAKEINYSNRKINLLKHNPQKPLIAIYDENNQLQLYNSSNDEIELIRTINGSLINCAWSETGDSIFFADENNAYIYEIEYNQENTNIKLEKSSSVIFGVEDISFDYNNLLFFQKLDDKVFISDYEMNLLDEFELPSFVSENYDLNRNILLSNDKSNSLVKRDLSKYTDNTLTNLIEKNNFIKVVPKNLSFKDINLGDICLDIPIDSLINNFVYNGNNKQIEIDSIFLENNSPNAVNINLTSNTLFSKQPKSLNLSIEGKELGAFSHNVKFISNLDTFNFKIIYNVINDNLEKINTYIDLGNLNYDENENYQFPLIENISDNEIKILAINIVKPSDKISITVQDSIILPNSSFNLDIDYNPNDISTSQLVIEIVTENTCTPFDFIILGRGVSPDFTLEDKYNLDSIICEGDKFHSIKIKNIGEGILKINDFNLINNNFNVSTNSSEISTDEELIFNFDLKGNDFGKIVDTLVIKTNNIFGKGNEFKIPISAVYLYSKLNIPDKLSFINPEKDKQLTTNFTIENNGLVEEKLIFNSIDKLGLFEVFNIEKENLKSNEESLVNVRFFGGNENILYEESFEVIDYCGDSHTITFSVDFRDAKPELSSISFIDFGEHLCDNLSIDTTLTIKNIGGAELVISNIEIKGEDATNFSFLNWSNEEIRLKTDDSFNLSINYSSSNYKEDNAFLEITSNDFISDKTQITLLGVFRNSNITSDKNEISFLNVESNKTHSATLTITNNGNIIEDLDYEIDNPIFNLSGISKAIINNNEKLILTIDFLGGPPDAIYSGNLLIKARCNNFTIPINAIVKGTNYFELSSNDISAKTGDVVSVPVNFSNPEDLVLNVPFIIETEMVVDKNIISPVKYDSYNEDDKKIIPLEYVIRDLNDKRLDNIEIKVTLGDKDNSEISFRNSKIVGDPRYYFEIFSSKLEIKNICIEGGNRFVEGSDSIFLNLPYPEPANDVINIGYGLIEDTYTELKIVDIFGNDVVYLINNKVSAHSNTLAIDVRKFAVGTYFIILSTSNNQITRRFRIIR